MTFGNESADRYGWTAPDPGERVTLERHARVIEALADEQKRRKAAEAEVERLRAELALVRDNESRAQEAGFRLTAAGQRAVAAVNALFRELPRYPVGPRVRPAHRRLAELWGEVDAAIDALGVLTDVRESEDAREGSVAGGACHSLGSRSGWWRWLWS